MVVRQDVSEKNNFRDCSRFLTKYFGLFYISGTGEGFVMKFGMEITPLEPTPQPYFYGLKVGIANVVDAQSREVG